MTHTYQGVPVKIVCSLSFTGYVCLEVDRQYEKQFTQENREPCKKKGVIRFWVSRSALDNNDGAEDTLQEGTV